MASDVWSTFFCANRFAAGLKSDQKPRPSLHGLILVDAFVWLIDRTRFLSFSYHGSNASSQLSTVSKRRPSSCSQRRSWACCSGLSSASGGIGPARTLTSMSSITKAANSGGRPRSTRSASMAAARMHTRPPIECPTRTNGRSIPCSAAAAKMSFARASGVKSSGGPTGVSP